MRRDGTPHADDTVTRLSLGTVSPELAAIQKDGDTTAAGNGARTPTATATTTTTMPSGTILLHGADGSHASWKASWTVHPLAPLFQSATVRFQRDVLSATVAFRRDEPLRLSIIDPCSDRGRIDHDDAAADAAELAHPPARDLVLDALHATTTTTATTRPPSVLPPPALTRSSRGPGEEERVVALLLVAPARAGNIIRADILRQRMQDLEYIEHVTTLAEPLQHYSGQMWSATTSLMALIQGSAGAIRLRAMSPSTADDGISETLARMQTELSNRLPSPWTVPHLRRRTLAFVEGSELLPNTGGCATQFYSAAASLGIDVVVLGVQGHWLQGPEYSHWRKLFIPIELGYDAGFSSRIVAAIRQLLQPVEALLTCFDSLHVAVSQAAIELGLPHEPPTAYRIATDKFQLSAFEGRTCFLATGIEHVVTAAHTERLPWPVIIKPCRGWGSELVFRADNAQQLVLWAESINAASSHGTDFVIEPYCDGPEVDINFVLYNGEILFWEIGDENPKSAESGSDSFHELDCVSPSELSEQEQHLLRDSIASTLRKLGFQNGIFHCEARVADSTHEWRTTASGSPVLMLRAVPPTQSASCFLMDCNVRPPGLNSSDVVETTWGVDYWALLIAIPLREDRRVRALAQPYRRGPQYFADMIFVSAVFDASKEGIWQSGNVTEELQERRPDLAKYISKALTYKKKGDRISHPSTGTNTFVAYLNIFSRQSREHVLEIATQVRKEINDSIHIS